MPKLILRCNYLKNAPPEHLLNYINYIGTREGVEKTDGTTALLPATARQKDGGAVCFLHALTGSDVIDVI